MSKYYKLILRLIIIGGLCGSVVFYESVVAANLLTFFSALVTLVCLVIIAGITVLDISPSPVKKEMVDKIDANYDSSTFSILWKVVECVIMAASGFIYLAIIWLTLKIISNVFIAKVTEEKSK